jgi:hypothetical protein
MKAARHIGRAGRPAPGAFTLLEVMIAIGIFFMAVFAILGLVASSLDHARRLQHPIVDASPVAGFLQQTNIFVEGVYEADLGEYLGKAYQGYRVTYEIREWATNRFFKVDYIVQSPGRNGAVVYKATAMYYKRQSPAGSLDGATVAR